MVICTVHNAVVHPHGKLVRCQSCGEGREMTTSEQAAFTLYGITPDL